MSLENKLITGYQWGADNIFIGEYKFPNNMDVEDIYLPPNTTLIAPPAFDITVHKAIWVGNEWVLEKLPEPPKVEVEPDVENIIDIDPIEITTELPVVKASTKKIK